MTDAGELPLAGLKIVEFTHMVMGPTVGVILADMGADVIKVEPVEGDHTRKLVGSGAGYFPMYNRNKRSLAIDLKSEKGLAIARDLISGSDVMIENFRPGAMERLGLDYESLSADNPGLIYCSQKGFLDGPYAHRTALDEVAQMMGGLAYMTGPPGRPLRAGASVIDVAGGMFGVIAILAAIIDRQQSGRGQHVTSSLYETTVFLVGQHMAQYAVTGEPANPMPVRISAWAIYDVFETADDDALFLGVVSDKQWQKFTQLFDLAELGADPALAANADRVARREQLLPQVRTVLKAYTRAELMARLEHSGLPFAPIAKPHELFKDPHLNQSGGLVPVSVNENGGTSLPALPVSMAGKRFSTRHDLPSPGADTVAILAELGINSDDAEALMAKGIVASTGQKG